MLLFFFHIHLYGFFFLEVQKLRYKTLPAFDKSNLAHCTSRGKGIAKQTSFSVLGLIPVYWSNVRCRGDEENILLCEKDIWQGGPCPQKMAAAVTCSSYHGEHTFYYCTFHCVLSMIAADKNVLLKLVS